MDHFKAAQGIGKILPKRARWLLRRFDECLLLREEQTLSIPRLEVCFWTRAEMGQYWAVL
jgi:hypothetical protein